MVKISKRVQDTPPSGTLGPGARIKALLAEGKDAISLGAGEFGHPPPQIFTDTMIEVLRDPDGPKGNPNRYMPAIGNPGLRERIAELYEQYYGLEGVSAKNTGSKICSVRHSNDGF